ncbi:hypothetical protein HEK616_07330 [Streptomyces nigrescens]|uniref:Uncharacterized protein n=1 Tax=Streptomyces nigrescens TaxID=1920 RepID=A0ABN6QNA3_STRNI|nr:hypothetical protein [Streptomyces nigrescens]BDM67246.1 hypothetical protein HEK616_07330 [Streptomyces nigrescens]
MHRIRTLLAPLANRPQTDASAPLTNPSASGFLTIGTTTYIDPHGTYPLDHRSDGTPSVIINDTTHPITILTESNHSHPATAPPTDPLPPLVLAPGERTETRRGDGVRVG